MYIHSSVSGHLGCFHVLAIVNSAAVILWCVYPFEPCFSLDICPGVGLLSHMVALFSVFFKGSPYCSPEWVYQFTFPPAVYFCLPRSLGGLGGPFHNLMLESELAHFHLICIFCGEGVERGLIPGSDSLYSQRGC